MDAEGGRSASPTGPGEMADLIRGFEWQDTALGPIETWPQSLRTIVDLMAHARQPIYIAWGPDLISLYNDAFIPILGSKHPAALGQPFEALWSEVWDDYRPLVEATLKGQAQHFVDRPVALGGRPGRPMGWFTFSYTPVRDDHGTVAGLFCAAVETTEKVLRERALKESSDEALRRSEERYQALFRSIDAGFCVLQMIFDGSDRAIDYRFLETNPVFERQTGLVDAVGRTARELVPNLEPHWFEIYGQVALTGRSTRFESGSEAMGRWFDVFAFPFGEPEARQVALLFNDVTQRKQVTAALQESEERFRNMADHAPIMLWVTNPQGACLYLNRAWYDYTGQTEQDALGYGWLEATHPDDRAEAERVFLEANAQQQPFRLEYRLRRSDGAYRWAIDAAAPRFGPDGTFLGYVGSVLDIDERREAEVKLQKLTNSVPAFVWFATADGALHYFNDRWYEYTGQTEAEALPDGWTSTLHPEDRERTAATWADARARGVTYEIEVRYRRYDGAYRWYVARAEPLYDANGAIANWFGTSIDIHDRRVAQEHQQLPIHELNHRVKNTLATVQSITSQTLRNAQSAAEARAAVEGRLFALSRAHDILTRENWEGAELRHVVEQAVAPFLNPEDKRIHLSGPRLRLAPRMALPLSMALQELGTNAVKYGALSKASGEVHVTWTVLQDDGEPRLELRWQEKGGPPVQVPDRRGFGSRLIERSLAQDLDGTARLEFDATGLVCTVNAPLRPQAFAVPSTRPTPRSETVN